MWDKDTDRHNRNHKHKRREGEKRTSFLRKGTENPVESVIYTCPRFLFSHSPSLAVEALFSSDALPCPVSIKEVPNIG